jgi:uncharacterized protein (TIGR02271 family)
MDTTVIGLFNDTNAITRVRQELASAGVDASAISTHPTGDAATGSTAATTSGSTAAGHHDRGFLNSLKDLFTGDDDAEGSRYVGYYSEGVRRGGTIVRVHTTRSQADAVAQILRRNGAVDIDRQAEQWRASGWTGYDETAPRYTQDQISAERQQAASIPVVEESIEVGKRQVQGGGVRVIPRIVEVPVEESVTLRQEHVHVERRPVNRDLTAAEAEAALRGTGQTIEATEMSEQAVVAKSARVTEEITVGKEVEQRTETVRDTVRKTEVEVEQLPGQTVERTDKTTDRTTGGTTERNRTRADQ